MSPKRAEKSRTRCRLRTKIGRLWSRPCRRSAAASTCGIETLQQFWSELDEYARGEIARSPGGLSQWLHARSPLWHRVGRVCFHLAENKRDPDCPFAFLATYAPKLIDGRRVQYQPLGKALEEYAGAKNKQTLVNLLAPVERASRRCGWVKELVDTGEIFHPLRWTPAEAYRFLQDAPALEDSGLLVRMPDWWSKTPPRVRVGVSIGQKRQSQFGVDAMLDFQVRLALEGETLSDEEWERILASSDGLVFLKGRWVEVDREKLNQVLQQWEQVEQAAGADGISFLQGMRLLAGASLDAELRICSRRKPRRGPRSGPANGSQPGSANFASPKPWPPRCPAASCTPRSAPIRRPASNGCGSWPNSASGPAWRTTWAWARRSRSSRCCCG